MIVSTEIRALQPEADILAQAGEWMRSDAALETPLCCSLIGAAMRCRFWQLSLPLGQEQDTLTALMPTPQLGTAVKQNPPLSPPPPQTTSKVSPPEAGLRPSAGAAVACAGPRRGRAALVPPARCPRTGCPASPGHGCGAGRTGALLSLAPAWGQGLEAGHGFADQGLSI